MYDFILFDLDGTLTDPKEGITKSVQYALAHLGIDEPDLEKLICFIGPPLKSQFMEYYGFSGEKATKAVEAFRERFVPIGIYENKPYAGIKELLAKLKSAGKILAVATNKPTVFAKSILQRFELIEYFDAIEGCELESENYEKKTIIGNVFTLLDPNGVLRKNAVMVGDRKHDIIAAKACGIDSIGLSFGYAGEGELEDAGANFIVDNLIQLENLLLNE